MKVASRASVHKGDYKSSPISQHDIPESNIITGNVINVYIDRYLYIYVCMCIYIYIKAHNTSHRNGSSSIFYSGPRNYKLNIFYIMERAKATL